MDYCGPRGIAHSTFKSWDQLDQQKALEWQRRQAEICSGCGMHPDRTDPDRGGDPGSLELGSRLCPACEIAERQREHFQKNREPGEYQVWKHRPPEPPGEQPGPDMTDDS